MIDHESEKAITKSITVGRDVQTAFRLWTERVNAWWPAGHSRSGDPETEVFIEGKIGGRFYERASNGVEYDWGRVVRWDPPRALVFSWYLGSDQNRPSQVQVTFVPLAKNQTRIEIEHRGPELIGALWERNKAGYKAAWDKVLSEYVAVSEQALF